MNKCIIENIKKHWIKVGDVYINLKNVANIHPTKLDTGYEIIVQLVMGKQILYAEDFGYGQKDEYESCYKQVKMELNRALGVALGKDKYDR